MEEENANVSATSVTMTLFHRTTEEGAAAILSDGFKDRRGSYGLEMEVVGIWLSDRPLDCNEGTSGDTLLRVTVTSSAADIEFYEVVEADKTFREWCFPAELINQRAVIERVSDADVSCGAVHEA